MELGVIRKVIRPNNLIELAQRSALDCFSARRAVGAKRPTDGYFNARLAARPIALIALAAFSLGGTALVFAQPARKAPARHANRSRRQQTEVKPAEPKFVFGDITVR